MNVLVESDLVCTITSSSACNYALRLFKYPGYVAARCTQCRPLITLEPSVFIAFCALDV
jgi:hypothetical protein